MKTSLCALVLGLGLLAPRAANSLADSAAASQPSAPPRLVLGLSPFLQKSEKDAVFRQIVGYLLENAPLESSLWLYDAYHLRTIAQMDIPDVRAFRSSKTRANQFKEQIARLREFLAAEHSKPEAPPLDFDRAVRFPQFMDFVGENLLAPNTPVTVIILGSPLYMDPKEPSFSMEGGAFPSDGHLLASREKTVYGLKTRAGRLDGVTVHFGWFGDPWVSEVHREKVSRFWSLYLARQGATLATFCGDLPTVFNAVKAAPASAPARSELKYALDPASTKVEMLRISREVATNGDWITADVVSNAASTPPPTTVGPLKIGIRWKGNIDLDLYAAPAPGSATLFFEHTRTPEGYYFKDHRHSPGHEYEFIEFEKPVNVWQVNAGVNFFAGHLRNPPGGEVRVEFAGRIYTGTFQLAARDGNEGRNGSGQESSWCELDLPKLLKLRDSPAAAASAAN